MLQYYISPESYHICGSYLNAYHLGWEEEDEIGKSKWLEVSWKKPTRCFVQVSRIWENLLCRTLRIGSGMFWHVFSPRFLPLLPEPVVIISLLLTSSSPTCFVEVTWVHCPWKWTKQMGKQCDEFKDTSILWEGGRRAEDRYISYPLPHNKVYHLASENNSHLLSHNSPWESGIEKGVVEWFWLRVSDGVAVKAVNWSHQHLKLGLTAPLLKWFTYTATDWRPQVLTHETLLKPQNWLLPEWLLRERDGDRGCRVLLWPSLGSEGSTTSIPCSKWGKLNSASWKKG